MSYIIAIGAYLFLLMIYGLVIAHKKVKTADDMVTGGHRIPFIILVGSLLATWCGGGGITGNASIIYNGGPWVGAITFAAPPIGIILLYFIAGKVRKSNKVTVPEIMGARYGQSASIISAVCVMLAYVGVLATQRPTFWSCCAAPAVWRSPVGWHLSSAPRLLWSSQWAEDWYPWHTPTRSVR